MPSPNTYEHIRHAIEQLSRSDSAPSLQTLADAAGQSVFQFQRNFVRLAGVTPKEFSQALTLARAQTCLARAESVLSAALHAGLSGPSRLHDLFIRHQGLTPGTYKHAGQGLDIQWTSCDTVLGPLALAATPRGVVRMAFLQDNNAAQWQAQAQQELPQAHWQEAPEALAPLTQEIQGRLSGNPAQRPIGLLMAGSPLRLKVWEALLRIPEGHVVSYSHLAQHVGAPRAVRAVASCVAANPIAYLIPCHRVIRANAEFGQYRWGPHTKRHLLGLELARHSGDGGGDGTIAPSFSG